MPLIHISLRRGKPAAYRKALFDSIHEAMHETYDVPHHNHFMTITEHDEDNFTYGKSFMGIARSDDLVYIQITANNTRTLEQKKALYRRLVDHLTPSPGRRAEHVFSSLEAA